VQHLLVTIKQVNEGNRSHAAPPGEKKPK
jgi:hypothetical protein